MNGTGVVWQLEHFLSLRKNERFLNKESYQNWKPWLCCPLWHNKYPGGLVGFHLLENPTHCGLLLFLLHLLLPFAEWSEGLLPALSPVVGVWSVSLAVF